MSYTAKLTVILFSLLSGFRGVAQEEFAWWNQLHNWDGVSHWAIYMKLSSRYMGPNALPIPAHTRALISEKPYVSTAAGMFSAPGDQTWTSELKAGIPFGGRVQVDAWGTPAEYFINDTLTRNERVVRYADSRGFATGDIWFSTTILVMKATEKRPDLTFRFGFKTASGSRLTFARYTDTPGYFFDLSAGKAFGGMAGKEERGRLYALAGFYAYQTFDDQHPQNDAYLYGIGASWIPFSKLKVSADFSGYSGYFNNGDRPKIVRAALEYPFGHSTFFIQQTIGLQDFPYYGTVSGILFTFAGSKN